MFLWARNAPEMPEVVRDSSSSAYPFNSVAQRHEFHEKFEFQNFPWASEMITTCYQGPLKTTKNLSEFI